MNAPVMDHGEFMAHPHTRAIDAVAYVEHAATGQVPMPHIPGLPRIAGESPLTHAPGVGEHTDEILSGILGLPDAEIARLHDDGVVKGPDA